MTTELLPLNFHRCFSGTSSNKPLLTGFPEDLFLQTAPKNNREIDQQSSKAIETAYIQRRSFLSQH